MNLRLFVTRACCEYCEMPDDESDTQVGMDLVFILEQERFRDENPLRVIIS